MSEKYGHLHRTKARLDAQAEVLGSVIRGLSGPQSEAVEHVNSKGHQRFNSEATLLLKAATRAQAVSYLRMFSPMGLDIILLRGGGQAIVTTSTRIIHTAVYKRESIVPFTYSLVQVRKWARRTLTWAHKLMSGLQVTIECDIAADRAEMVLQHLDDVAHNQVLFRRSPNNWLPSGRHHEVRGLDWSTVKDVPASLVVWWPWTHPEVVTTAKKHEGEAWPQAFEELAEVLLEVWREEAQV